VHQLYRVIRMWLRRGGPKLELYGVSRVRFRTWPSDIDVFRHMNNGVYFSILDHGRSDMLFRTGLAAQLRAAGVYAVVAGETMTFRKSLLPWQAFVVETTVAGFDERSIYLEQRFVVDGEIYAKAFIRSRFLRTSGGTVSIAAELGVDVSARPDPWLIEWAERTALPPSRAAAPSEWD
jgi:acyl-CoA thioesterase FadM